MNHRHLPLLLALATLAACGNHDAPENAADSLIAASTTTTPVAKNSHVRSFDLGLAVDSTHRVSGGVSTNFHPRDTIYASIRTEYAPEGTTISARLSQGKTTVDSVELKTAAPNAEGSTVSSTRFLPPAKGWPVGSLRFEVLLDGVSQGLSEFKISN